MVGLLNHLLYFLQENVSDFRDRGRLDVNYEDAENLLKGFRVFIDQEYLLIHKKDSLSPSRFKPLGLK